MTQAEIDNKVNDIKLELDRLYKRAVPNSNTTGHQQYNVLNSDDINNSNLVKLYGELQFLIQSTKDKDGSIVDNSVSMDDFLKKHKLILNNRSDIDVKLQELYGMPGSMNDTFLQQYDSTIYLSVIWSVLATSLLFYVFIKL